MTTPTTPMAADDVLATIARHRDAHDALSVSDAYSAQEYPRLRDAHDAVAAVYAERDALAATQKDAMSLILDIKAGLAELLLEREALLSRVAELETGAARWQHARKLLTIDDIEGTQGALESFGGLVSEDESKRADEAIDAARSKGGAS